MEEARQALRAYDYVVEGDTWYHRIKRNKTQAWQESGNGFIRLDPENGSWYRVPYKMKDEFQLGGLDFREPTHDIFFEWVWPADYVTQMYRDAWEAKRAYAEQRAIEKNQQIIEAAQETVAEAQEIIASVTPPEEPKSFIDKLLGN